MGRDLRFYAFGALAYGLVLELLLVAAIVYWPEFEDNVDAIRDFMPGELKGALDRIASGGVASYLHAQHFFKGCNTLGTLAAVIFAMGAVAGEAHRGTLEIWIARPVSRKRLLLERWIGGALAVCVPVFATTATAPFLLGTIEVEMQLGPLMFGAVHESLVLLVLYSMAFLWSCLATRIVGIAFGMLLFALLHFVAYLIPVVTHWSFYRLSDIDVFAGIGATHALDWRMCVPMIAASAILLIVSLRVFERRMP